MIETGSTPRTPSGYNTNPSYATRLNTIRCWLLSDIGKKKWYKNLLWIIMQCEFMYEVVEVKNIVYFSFIFSKK